MASNGFDLPIDETFGFPIRTNYPSEDRFFKSRPEVAGMFSPETKSIILNPFNRFDDEQRGAVARLEGFRGLMHTHNITPKFKLTKKQIKFLQGTKEAADIEDGIYAKRTIASRILVGDKSAQDVTPEQKKEVERILKKFSNQ